MKIKLKVSNIILYLKLKLSRKENKYFEKKKKLIK